MIQEDFVFATDESEVKEDRMKPVSVAGKRILLAKIDGRVYASQTGAHTWDVH